jgi:hypothetical protein
LAAQVPISSSAAGEVKNRSFQHTAWSFLLPRCPLQPLHSVGRKEPFATLMAYFGWHVLNDNPLAVKLDGIGYLLLAKR